MDKSSQYLPKLHNDILEIADAVDMFCKEENLSYYLAGGSLLGAVRHNGFIPWDDDLDICMPRKDYEFFLNNFCKSNSYRFKIISSDTDKQFVHGSSKVGLIGTSFKESSIFDYPISIDIFPLDKTDGNLKKIERSKKLCLTLMHLRLRKLAPMKFSFKSILSKIIGIKNFDFIIKHTIIWNETNNYFFYTNYFSQYGVERQTMPIEWYGTPIRVKFEDRYYNAPVKYNEVLKSIYGPNYMQIPPKEKRRTHYPLRVIFSDGQEMSFKLAEHKVTIEESLV